MDENPSAILSRVILVPRTASLIPRTRPVVANPSSKPEIFSNLAILSCQKSRVVRVESPEIAPFMALVFFCAKPLVPSDPTRLWRTPLLYRPPAQQPKSRRNPRRITGLGTPLKAIFPPYRAESALTPGYGRWRYTVTRRLLIKCDGKVFLLKEQEFDLVEADGN